MRYEMFLHFINTIDEYLGTIRLVRKRLNNNKNHVYMYNKYVIYRDSFWPGGELAEPRSERKTDVKMRTRVASKTKMFGSIPGTTHLYYQN